MVNTKNRGGSTINKKFTVYTNDPANAQVRLKVTGKVKGYVTVTPGYVRLIGPVGRPLSRTVQILPLDGHKFTIKEVKARQDKFLRYNVKPMDKTSGKEGYLLLVENMKRDPGNYRDTIIIKTDSKEKPLLHIPIYARIQNPPPSKGQSPK